MRPERLWGRVQGWKDPYGSYGSLFFAGFCSLKAFCCRNSATKRCYRCSAWRDKQLDFQREDWSPGLACDWSIISLESCFTGSCFTAGTHLILLILTDNPQMVRTGTISLVRLPFVTKGAAEIVHYRRKGRGRITSLRVTNLDGHGCRLQTGPSLNGGTPIPPQVKRCARWVCRPVGSRGDVEGQTALGFLGCVMDVLWDVPFWARLQMVFGLDLIELWRHFLRCFLDVVCYLRWIFIPLSDRESAATPAWFEPDEKYLDSYSSQTVLFS